MKHEELKRLEQPDLIKLIDSGQLIHIDDINGNNMAEDMWEPVSPEERKKYCERYGAILKAVNVLEELQSENGGNNND